MGAGTEDEGADKGEGEREMGGWGQGERGRGEQRGGTERERGGGG